MDEFVEPGDDQGEMSLAGGAEVGLYAEVDLHVAAGEPPSPSRCKRLGLLPDLEPEDTSVELVSFRLTTTRHSELHVVEGSDPGRHQVDAVTPVSVLSVSRRSSSCEPEISTLTSLVVSKVTPLAR